MGNQETSHLTPETVSDLEACTSFRADEIREFYKDFIGTTGTEHDDLNREEFIDMYSKIFPKRDAKQFAKQVFRNYDRNGNGTIDFREFLVNLSIQLKGTLEEKLEWTFNLYDIDKSGTIKKDELVTMLQSIHGLKSGSLPGEKKFTAAELADYIMHRADKNNDNKLSRDEFIQGAIECRTIQSMVIGSLQASTSPFTKRKSIHQK